MAGRFKNGEDTFFSQIMFDLDIHGFPILPFVMWTSKDAKFKSCYGYYHGLKKSKDLHTKMFEFSEAMHQNQENINIVDCFARMGSKAEKKK